MNFPAYNPNLKDFARQLRSDMTLAEVLLWKKINKRQRGVRFNRQKPIKKWVVDFYCKELQLAIEVDGCSHNFKQADDDQRQRQLESLGIRFLRFWDHEIKNEMGSVIERIDAWIRENPPRPAATPPGEGTVHVKISPSKGVDIPLHSAEGGGSSSLPSSGGVAAGRGGSLSLPSPPPEGWPQAGVGRSPVQQREPNRGSALVVVMWILMIVALIVSSFAFEMQLESRIIVLQRKRFKADQLALAGIELARCMLAFKDKNNPSGAPVLYEDPWLNEAVKIAAGIPVRYSEELGGGTVNLRIDYEKGRRNIRTMTRDEWKLLFDQAGVPNTEWDSLLDCLEDWQDEDDLHRLNGAESDDPFYVSRGYECKNAPVDTVDELLLIKGWTRELLYGTPPGDDSKNPLTGIAGQLTTWGDGRINPNSASREVLNSTALSEGVIDAILELRLGPDGKEGTPDDGLTEADFAPLGLNPSVFTLKPEYVSVTSIGNAGGITRQISCIFKLGEGEAVPLFWLEGNQEEKKVPAPEPRP